MMLAATFMPGYIACLAAPLDEGDVIALLEAGVPSSEIVQEVNAKR